VLEGDVKQVSCEDAQILCGILKIWSPWRYGARGLCTPVW